jgi:hypothetical protein
VSSVTSSTASAAAPERVIVGASFTGATVIVAVAGLASSNANASTAA